MARGTGLARPDGGRGHQARRVHFQRSDRGLLQGRAGESPLLACRRQRSCQEGGGYTHTVVIAPCAAFFDTKGLLGVAQARLFRLAVQSDIFFRFRHEGKGSKLSTSASATSTPDYSECCLLFIHRCNVRGIYLSWAAGHDRQKACYNVSYFVHLLSLESSTSTDPVRTNSRHYPSLFLSVCAS